MNSNECIVCRHLQLYLGLNVYTGYAAPRNLNVLNQPYMYYGFLPITHARNRYVQGLKVVSYSFYFSLNNFEQTMITLQPMRWDMRGLQAAYCVFR